MFVFARVSQRAGGGCAEANTTRRTAAKQHFDAIREGFYSSELLEVLQAGARASNSQGATFTCTKRRRTRIASRRTRSSFAAAITS